MKGVYCVSRVYSGFLLCKKMGSVCVCVYLQFAITEKILVLEWHDSTHKRVNYSISAQKMLHKYDNKDLSHLQ